MAEYDCAQHHLLRQLGSFRFHHEHRVLGAGDDEVQFARFELRHRRIEHELAIDVSHARRTDGAVERYTRERERGRAPDERCNVRVYFGIDRHDGGNDLHLVVEPVGKQRTDGPVDKPRGQRVLFRRSAFALEKPARNLPRRVVLLDVVHREREEILARPGLVRSSHRAKHDRVVHVYQHGTSCLPRDLARFERYLVSTVSKRFLDGVQCHLLPSRSAIFNDALLALA